MSILLLSYLAESFAAEPVSLWAVKRVDELKGCFNPLHNTCIRAMDSVTCQRPAAV